MSYINFNSWSFYNLRLRQMNKPLAYFVNIEKEIKNREQKFIESCAQSVENLKGFLDESYQKSQKVFTDSDLSCMNLKIEGNNYRAQVQKNQFKVQEMEKWIEIKKLAMQLQQRDLLLAQQLNEILTKGKQSMQLKHKSLINKQNEKKMRLDKVDQFIKNCQAPNQSALQAEQRRLYTPKNNQDPGLGIRFLPQSRELIFRIQTFDRKVAEFILFFQEQQKRYCLKNPYKNLQSSDLIAVKNFNIHNDELRLYQELKAIVVKHIDNNEDEDLKI